MSSLYSYSSGSHLGVICSVSNACVCVCVCVWSSTTNIGLVEARDLLNILQCPEQRIVKLKMSIVPRLRDPCPILNPKMAFHLNTYKSLKSLDINIKLSTIIQHLWPTK